MSDASQTNTTVVVVKKVNTIAVVAEPTTLAARAPGPQGAPGRDGADGSAFEFEQPSPAAQWTITHNLGKYPAPAIQINNELVYADVEYVDDNTVVITFPEPYSGSVHLV